MHPTHLQIRAYHYNQPANLSQIMSCVENRLVNTQGEDHLNGSDCFRLLVCMLEWVQINMILLNVASHCYGQIPRLYYMFVFLASCRVHSHSSSSVRLYLAFSTKHCCAWHQNDHMLMLSGYNVYNVQHLSLACLHINICKKSLALKV